jgi:restriction endonuclease S subunit
VTKSQISFVRLGYLATIQSGVTVDSNRNHGPDDVTLPYLRVANVQDGRLDLRAITEIQIPRSVAHSATLKRGDVLMTEGGDLDKLGRGTVWNDEIANCLHQNHVFAVRPDQRQLMPEYLALVTQSSYARAYFESTGTKTTNLASTNSSKIRDFKIPLIELDEQRRIADFLDAETARIDALQVSRRAQAAILDELELARIGKHLSAIETTGPVYAYFDVELGKMLNAERASGDNQQQYLRNANVQWYEIDTDDMATMTFEPHERLRYGVRPGDLLVCEGGYVGRSAVWDGRFETCFYQKSLHRVRTRGQVPVEWLMYWLRYANAIGIFEAEGNLTTIQHLTGEQLAEYRIPIPEDGHRRVAELASEIAAIRETQRKMAAADALLAERRQALITAAVTGGVSV